ncbi:hypothetical protein BH09BAC6_BH09BAC6_01770 [soil metagenome]
MSTSRFSEKESMTGAGKTSNRHFFEAADRFNGGYLIQPKLSVNTPGDVYEQEADHMADKVMRMADRSVNSKVFFKPAVSSVQRKCAACDEEKNIQRKENTTDAGQGGGQLDSYVSSLGSSGRQMSEVSRKFFEPRFGHDFSNVRLHTDAVAAKSAQSINALAYSTGNHIVFNSGQYSPESDSGKKLIAHELTHVIQQKSLSNQAVQMKPGDGCGTDFLYQFDAVANSEKEKDHRGVPRLFYTAPTGKSEDVAKYFVNTPITLTPGMSLPAGQTSKYGWRAVCFSPAAGAPEMIYWVLDEYLSKPKKEEVKKKEEPKIEDTPKKEEPKKEVEPKVEDNPKKEEPEQLPGLWTYCPAPVPAVDDAVVQSIINKHIADNTDKSTGKADISAAYDSIEVLRGKKEGCCDVNLAAAEHYMYARKEAEAGRPLALAELYDLSYYLYKTFHLPFPNAGTGVCPKTRSSFSQFWWGGKGTLAGKADYDKANGGPWGSSPTKRFPDGTWYDKDGNMHMGPGPKW